MGAGRRLSLGQLTVADGASRTLLLVEAGEAIPWTKPDDLAYDPKKPLPKLGGVFAGGFHACFADGTIRFAPKNVDEMLLRRAIEWNDGHEFDVEKFGADVTPK